MGLKDAVRDIAIGRTDVERQNEFSRPNVWLKV